MLFKSERKMFGRTATQEKVDEEVLHLESIRNSIKEIIEWDKDRLQFTPDYPTLSQRRSHLFFVPDDMAQLQHNHNLIHGGSLSGFYPLAYGYTTKRFSFVKKELGLKSFPIALELSRDTQDNLPVWMSDEYRLRGEIYAIRPQQFIVLDTHRQNGVQFERVKLNINIGFQKYYKRKGKPDYFLEREEMITVPMFMYVGREAYWKDQLEAGFFDFKQVTLKVEDRLWLREYYEYSRVR